MIKRKEYSPYEYIENYSTKNEPLPCRYPDMNAVYDKFSKLFNLPRNNFILTNGCENALRITLLALGIKSIKVETPGWELAKVIPESLGIETSNLNLEFFTKSEKEEEINYDYGAFSEDDSAIYLTPVINNFAIHSAVFPENNIYDKYMIFDESYLPTTLMEDSHKSFLKEKHNKSIVIGSFSKIKDPGLRLGYVIFNDVYNDRFQLLREQYISKAACDYILNLPDKSCIDIGKPQIIDDRINKYTVGTKTFHTWSEKINTKYPYKAFDVLVHGSNKYRTLFRYGFL